MAVTVRRIGARLAFVRSKSQAGGVGTKCTDLLKQTLCTHINCLDSFSSSIMLIFETE